MANIESVESGGAISSELVLVELPADLEKSLIQKGYELDEWHPDILKAMPPTLNRLLAPKVGEKTFSKSTYLDQIGAEMDNIVRVEAEPGKPVKVTCRAICRR